MLRDKVAGQISAHDLEIADEYLWVGEEALAFSELAGAAEEAGIEFDQLMISQIAAVRAWIADVHTDPGKPGDPIPFEKYGVTLEDI